jgi:lysophospholipase L1-like esterase
LIINELIRKARETGSKVIFYISPVTSNKPERETINAVFNLIPAENKIHYDQSFLDKLNNPALFSDPTHLNSAGAILFTNYLAEQIRRLN